MILALTLCVIAQTPVARAAPRIKDPAEARAFNYVQKALIADPKLLGEYRGLRGQLAADEDLRQAEENYQALMELPGLRARVDDFEEVLRMDPAARADFDRYFARLRRDPALRGAIEQLWVAEEDAGQGRPELAAAFAQLRVHPEQAAGFFTAPGRVVPMPEALRPLREALRRKRDVHAQLREAWIGLESLAGAREAVYPWWARAYAAAGAVARAWRALDIELGPFPSRRRAWGDREIAWAAYSESVVWRDHFYARVRRNADLAKTFFGYLRSVRTRPELGDYAEAAFAAASGPLPAWPPAGTPPSLPGWSPREAIRRPEGPKAPSFPSPRAPSAGGPERPAIDRPSSPARPRTPKRTEIHGAPADPRF